MSEYTESSIQNQEASVAHFYSYADAVRRSVAWLMKDELDEISDYGNELIGTAVDDHDLEISVCMEFDDSVSEEVGDEVVPARRQDGRTNTVGILSEFFVEQREGEEHKLYASIVSTAVGIEGEYRKLIASEGDPRLGILSAEADRQVKGDVRRLADLHLDVSRRSERMSQWRFRQTREFETLLQDEWCVSSQDLHRYIAMKTINMRDVQIREYQVALNLFLEELYRNGRSVKASFTEPEVVTSIQPIALSGESRLARVGEEASLIALALKRRGQQLYVDLCMEKINNRDELYEIDASSTKGVIFGTLENIRSSQEKSG